VGPTGGLDVLEKRKSPSDAAIRTPDNAARSLGAIPTTPSWLQRTVLPN
jgi:hypothetical protein